MFGSPEMTIVATESREGEVVLIDRGRWAGRFVAAAFCDEHPPAEADTAPDRLDPELLAAQARSRV